MRVVNCVPVVQTGSVTVMARDIGAALRSHGLAVRNMEYRPGRNAPEALPELVKWLSESDNGGLLVDINGAIITSKPGARAMERHAGAIESFSFITDTPLHFPGRLENWPLGAMAGLVDSSFFDLARFMKYQRPHFFFHPHGGPPVPSRPRETPERDIEILFIGNIARADGPAVHASSLYGSDPALVALFVTSFENLTPDKTPFQVTLETARGMANAYRRKDVALVAVHLEVYLSNVSRLQTLESLKGLGVTVVGEVAEQALGTGSDIRALGFHPFAACLDLIGRAKILVNIVPSFPNGAHERIFYALSRGTAVMTTRSTFLEADRLAHGFIEFFDIADKNIREESIALRDNLDRDGLDHDAMSRHYENHHTWGQRLEPILNHLREKHG
jgi:hypothetical protein